MILTTQGFLDVVIEIKLEWDKNAHQLDYIQAL